MATHKPDTAAGPLRIVLFGLPRSGKTGLLAALAQTEGTLLDDPTGNLTRLKKHHYDEDHPPAGGETVAYPVRFRTPHGLVDAVLIDSDGREPGQMLKIRTSVKKIAGALPAEILGADVLLLVADLSVRPETLERVLTAFDEFLDQHEQERSQNSEVTGLPVFLVLTKADLLAQEKDGHGDWMGKIEQQKRRVYAKLQDFLEDVKKRRPTIFGRLDIHLWATATGRPALGTKEARPQEPYGVAELFQQCLEAAGKYRQRREHSGRLLRWAVGGVSGVAAALAVVTGFLMAGLGHREPNELQRQVDQYRALEGTTLEDRLHDHPPDLQRRVGLLDGILKDDRFATLTPESQEFVEERRAELTEYLPYLEKVLSPRFLSLARTEAEIRRREQVLLRDLKLPHTDWAATGAGNLRALRLKDLQMLRDRADRTVAWYRGLYNQGEELRQFRRPEPQDNLIDWRAWQDEVEAYLRKVTDVPPAAKDLPEASLVTAPAVMRLDHVRSAREVLLGPDDRRVAQPGLVQRLLVVRDLATAIGLADPTSSRPDLLVIPRPPGFPHADAVRTWQRLESHPAWVTSIVGLSGRAGSSSLGAALAFPPTHPLISPYPDFETEFRLDHVPEAARPEVVRAAGGNYQNLIVPLRDLVRAHAAQVIRGAADRPEHWRTVADWLASAPPEVQAYRRLAVVTDRLRRAAPTDPVADLIVFLRKTEYDLDIKGLTLSIPFSRGVSPPDNAVLTLKLGQQEYTFRNDPGRKQRDPEERTITYYFAAPAGRLTLRAGELCEAVLPLRDDKMFTWSGSRTRTFTFEALARSPILHDRGEPVSQGARAEGVRLQLDPKGEFPRIPDLLPAAQPSRPEP